MLFVVKFKLTKEVYNLYIFIKCIFFIIIKSIVLIRKIIKWTYLREF